MYRWEGTMRIHKKPSAERRQVDTLSDRAEKELARMIERTASKEPDPEEREELWRESVRAYNTRRSEENRLAWCEYHQGQATRHRAVLESLIASHEEQAVRLMEAQPKGA
jgi:hypothetical protein